MDWTPCAIGALPSVCDPNGRLSTFEAIQSQEAVARPSASETQPHAKVHASPMAFAVQSAQPSKVHSHSVEAANGLHSEGRDLDRERSASDNLGYTFADYWGRFHAVDKGASIALVETQCVLVPQGKAVKVL